MMALRAAFGRAAVHRQSAAVVRRTTTMQLQRLQAVRSLSSSSGDSSSSAELPKVPSIEQARSMPTDMSHLSNEAVYVLAEQAHPHATHERLTRHIMAVDGKEYAEAKSVTNKMEEETKHFNNFITLPYRVGIATALVAGWGCLPIIFHRGTATKFNHLFVTTDLPDKADFETTLEVGSWTWGFMEPPLGGLSFTLLCLQFARAQMENWGVRPYSGIIRDWRANNLVKAYPQYCEDIVREFAETRPLRK
eukprot:TRINITY_DN49549_c0_g1_i1.p2 TRINITY_DN49549_c0_g1~~TRINITY_DN49549_c0_g1_i1.p2  ORF type:complete len:249 (+),score=56.62 TRINITY_DN49549_c0_g1_i1:69-815(+)